MKPSLPFIVWLIAFILHSIIIFSLKTQLPDRVAKQFSFDGRPTSWISKDNFINFNLLMPLGISLALYLLMRVFPKSANIPNKAYWLDHQRFPVTSTRLLNFAWWASSLLTVFMSFIFIGLQQGNQGTGFNYNAMLPWLIFAMIVLIFGNAMLLWSWFQMFKLPKSVNPR